MDESISPHPTSPARRRPTPGRETFTRRPAGILAVGLLAAVTLGACAGDTASNDWTFAPTADTVSAPTSGQSSAPAPADIERSPGAERAQPLEPPAGNVIPRFVDPERADQPEAADAIAAPVQIDADATQTSATGSPATGAPATGEPTATSSALATQPAVVKLTLVAQSTAFDADELTVTAGAMVRITLENRDPIPHNLAVYLTDTADEAVFQGETFSGPGATRTYELTAPSEPGEYFFRCDVHPQLMTGTFIIE